MGIQSETLQDPSPPSTPGLNLVRTQKKLMLKRVTVLIKEKKKIKLDKLIATLFIEDGFSKKTAKEYIEMLYNGEYIKIKGEPGQEIVTLNKEIN